VRPGTVSAAPPKLANALPKKSARKKFRLNSNGLGAIKALAHNLFHKICEEYRHRSNDGGTALARSLGTSGRVIEDATIPQPPRTLRQGPVSGDNLCTSPVCLKNGLEHKS
jgi:hypothetical protein